MHAGFETRDDDADEHAVEELREFARSRWAMDASFGVRSNASTGPVAGRNKDAPIDSAQQPRGLPSLGAGSLTRHPVRRTQPLSSERRAASAALAGRAARPLAGSSGGWGRVRRAW